MRRVLITGAGRGLGLEFVNQYLKRGDIVFAGVRNPEKSQALQQLQAIYSGQLSMVVLDVADPNSIDASYNIIRGQTLRLDLLINCAGINSTSLSTSKFGNAQVLGQLDTDQMLFMFRVNSIAPILVSQRYLELLQAGGTPRIVSLSSTRGSLTLRTSGGNYGYVASKAALNMLMRNLAFDVLPLGIVAVVVDPGWVKTDMGGFNAPLTPEESVQGLVRVIDDITEQDAGHFLTWRGLEHPW